MNLRELTTRCGIKLYVVEMPNVQSVACGVLVHAGTCDENWPKEAGLAHAFEHMVFRGTSEFPTSKELTGYLERIGGYVNAWTWKEMTFYFNAVPKHRVDRSINYLYELLVAPQFRSEFISTEMSNIVEEIKRANDDPSGLVGDIADEVLYGEHPLAKRTLGTIEAVKSFTHDDFVRWHDAYYHSTNLVFLVVGNISAEEALRLIDEKFIHSSLVPKNERRLVGHLVAPTTRLKVLHKDIEQVHICLEAPIGGSGERSTSALKLFSRMIDGGMSFPLFQEMRDKRGLCYAVDAGVTPWTEFGTFQVCVGTDTERWQLAVDTIFNVIHDNIDNEALFNDAKESCIGRTCYLFDSPLSVIGKLAQDLVFRGRPVLAEESISEIQSLTLDEVVEAARRNLRRENFVQAMIVPHGLTVE